MIDAQTIITVVTVLGSAGAWQFYQNRMKLKHQEKKEDRSEQTLFRDDLRERVAVLEEKLGNLQGEGETQERLVRVMQELTEYKVRLEYLEKENERLKDREASHRQVEAGTHRPRSGLHPRRALLGRP